MIRFLFLGIIFLSTQLGFSQHDSTLNTGIVNGTPKIDGKTSDGVWKKQEWRKLNQTWLGQPPTEADYSGQYKLAWDDSCLYVLAVIGDDTLVDNHPNPLERYWDDDCLEIFVDADASGGNHQYSHQAFAYHLSLNGKDVADVNRDSSFILLNSHVIYKRSCWPRTITKGESAGQQSGLSCIWECKVRLFSNDFIPGMEAQTRQKLVKGKNVGFMLAYCDNDHSVERENFMGSVFVPGEDKNQGWINASIFEKLELK